VRAENVLFILIFRVVATGALSAMVKKSESKADIHFLLAPYSCGAAIKGVFIND
jgi:hypothetical protein